MKGFVYRRGDSPNWWVAYFDERGHRRQISSGSTDRAFAARFLASLERKIAAARKAGIASDVMTVERYAGDWIADRRARGVGSWRDDRGRLAHVMPVLGKRPLDEVKPSEVRALMAELRAAGKLAPRTVRHIYATLRVMYADAMAEELVTRTPCILKERRGEIPKKRDATPGWRDTAVFSRDEVEQLVFDTRLPDDRRMLYALLFLGGMRIGELAARTWADWDESRHPLTCLDVRTSWNRKERRIKSVKTDRPRKVPVHPALAVLLRDWREHGWQERFGRPPRPEDLITPSRRGLHLRDPVVLERLHHDLGVLGLRIRRIHDTRRTFLSLGRGDGARSDLLRWVSHGPEGDIVDAYTSMPWEALCAEVAKLRVVTPQLRSESEMKKPPSHADLGAFSECPGRDSKPDRSDSMARDSIRVEPAIALSPGDVERQRASLNLSERNHVTEPDPGGYVALAMREGLTVLPPPTVH